MVYWSTIIGVLFGIYLAWPCAFDPQEFVTGNPPALSGAYNPSKCSLKADTRQRLHLPQLVGPESLVFDTKGNMYAGTLYGGVYKVSSLNTPPVLLTTMRTLKCENTESKECGRPLGLRMLNNDTLLVVDLFHGLFSVNTDTGATRLLLEGGDLIAGQEMTMLNDLDVDLETQTVYVSQITQRWPFPRLNYEFVEGTCTGRILSYHIPTGEADEVATGLCFPNGVQLSKDGQSLLFTESTRFRLSQLSLEKNTSSSSSTNTTTVLDDNIAGIPDNIRPHPDGGYLVAVPSLRTKVKSTELLNRWPLLRRLIWKITPGFAYSFIEDAMVYGMCLHYHNNGTILDTYHFHDVDNFRHISQCTVAPDKKTMYVSSRVDSGVVVMPIA
ncbi:adipocyte plasma membrane-associated protein-like isoform X2 [Sycon ciliatum]|uniref:adipocyte plasma membrane-associated protein-like isoform X2 n=1 Tax=Sycon ciliatum TaxID=27933 RepID=UPI0031F6B693